MHYTDLSDFDAPAPLDERRVLEICANLVSAPTVPGLLSYIVTLAALFRFDPRWPGLAVIAEERLRILQKGDTPSGPPGR